MVLIFSLELHKGDLDRAVDTRNREEHTGDADPIRGRARADRTRVRTARREIGGVKSRLRRSHGHNSIHY